MEISNSQPMPDHVKIKEENKDDSESTPMLKHIHPLPSAEPTKLPQVVPGPVQHTETVFTGTICSRGERLPSIQTSDKLTHTNTSEDLSHQLALQSHSGIQPATDYC